MTPPNAALHSAAATAQRNYLRAAFLRGLERGLATRAQAAPLPPFRPRGKLSMWATKMRVFVAEARS